MTRRCFLEGLTYIGQDGRISHETHEIAKFLWVSVRGAKIELCEPCCMQWRKTHGPELTPVRITMIDQEDDDREKGHETSV